MCIRLLLLDDEPSYNIFYYQEKQQGHEVIHMKLGFRGRVAAKSTKCSFYPWGCNVCQTSKREVDISS